MRTDTAKYERTPFTDHLADGDGILDIGASGRYWRTSRLERVSVITGTTERTAFSEKEADEYSLLLMLSEELAPMKRIITFNGRAFDLPHLRRKYAAYGLPDPFCGKPDRDLFIDYRSLSTILSLPSRRLSDYAAFLLREDASNRSDAANTLAILSFDAFLDLLQGKFVLKDASGDQLRDAVVYTLETPGSFPSRISVHDGIYHLTYEGNRAKLAVHIRDGKIRCYHTDTDQYEYLPLEGYAIHKAMSVYVDKTRKEKAVRENCFHLVQYSDEFLNREDLIIRYIRSALDYIRSR